MDWFHLADGTDQEEPSLDVWGPGQSGVCGPLLNICISQNMYVCTYIYISCVSARNGNFEVPVYFLKAKQGYTFRKMKKKR
jgi:hypothetical protein